jgi:hypothetical protein
MADTKDDKEKDIVTQGHSQDNAFHCQTMLIGRSRHEAGLLPDMTKKVSGQEVTLAPFRI